LILGEAGQAAKRSPRGDGQGGKPVPGERRRRAAGGEALSREAGRQPPRGRGARRGFRLLTDFRGTKLVEVALPLGGWNHVYRNR